jgi:hypothetical protein
MRFFNLSSLAMTILVLSPGVMIWSQFDMVDKREGKREDLKQQEHQILNNWAGDNKMRKSLVMDFQFQCIETDHGQPGKKYYGRADSLRDRFEDRGTPANCLRSLANDAKMRQISYEELDKLAVQLEFLPEDINGQRY